MKLLCLGGDTSCARGLKGPHHFLLEEFHKYWERIDYLCPYHEEAQPLTLFENVYFHPAPKGRWKRISWLKNKGCELIKSQQHDLIGVHEYPPFFNGIAARHITEQTGVPHILEIYHVEGYPKASNWKEFLIRISSGIYFNWASQKAKKIRVINKSQVPNFLKQHGIDEEKLLLLYSSYTDFEIFKPQEIKKDFDIIFIGRLVDNKGLWNLLKAIEQIQPTPQTYLVGTGPLRKSLETWVKQKKLQDFVKFHGWAKDNQEIASLINRAHCLVCCSYSEGGPRTTLEAMACSVPVVTTPVGTMIDMINHRTNGLLTDFSYPSLAQELDWLLKNKNKAKLIGEAGRESIQDFERQKLIAQYAQGYQNVIEKTTCDS